MTATIVYRCSHEVRFWASSCACSRVSITDVICLGMGIQQVSSGSHFHSSKPNVHSRWKKWTLPVLSLIVNGLHYMHGRYRRTAFGSNSRARAINRATESFSLGTSPGSVLLRTQEARGVAKADPGALFPGGAMIGTPLRSLVSIVTDGTR